MMSPELQLSYQNIGFSADDQMMVVLFSSTLKTQTSTLFLNGTNTNYKKHNLIMNYFQFCGGLWNAAKCGVVEYLPREYSSLRYEICVLIWHMTVCVCVSSSEGGGASLTFIILQVSLFYTHFVPHTHTFPDSNDGGWLITLHAHT